jgi:hypothetical protein
VANTSPDEIAQLKQELAQFLLAEITSAQGAATFRQEVGEQVGAVIDKILAERLTPALARLEQESAQQIRGATDRVDQMLRRLEEAAPGSASPAGEQQLADVTTRLDEVRQRLARLEDRERNNRGGGAMAQPLRAPEPAVPERGDGEAPAAAAPWPRWALWLLLLIGLLTVVGLGNIYYERLMAPAPETNSAVPTPVMPKISAAPPADTTAAPPPAAVSVPPQKPAAIPAVTPAPAPPSASPPPTPTPVPQPHARNIPADFAIERGWLAAQPFAVEPRLARQVGSRDSIPTLKSVVCGRGANCTSDALLSGGSDAKQVIALQMLMSQIGDRFCVPRRAVDVTGQVTPEGLADLAAIAKCAGGTAHPCVETENRVCPPDADALLAGTQAARAALLRWALWKTGST